MKRNPILNEIDRELAERCGLTAEELDHRQGGIGFIINYDINPERFGVKYRLGRDAGEEED